MKRHVTLFLGLMAAAQPAPAATNVLTSAFGPDQSITYVDNTYITSLGGNHLALCHAVERQALFGIGLWIVSDGYVLSETNCDGQSARESAGLINVAFASGALGGTPREPVLSMRQRVEGHAGSGVLGFAALAGLGWRMSRRGSASASPAAASRSDDRREALDFPDDDAFRAIDVMLHAANADGPASPEQVEFIRWKASELCNVSYTTDHIEWVINLTDKLETTRGFAQFGQGLDEATARETLRTALAVLVSDGIVSAREQTFLKQLSVGLGLDEADARYLMQDPSSAVAAQ